MYVGHKDDESQARSGKFATGSFATYQGCGGIFKYVFVANLPLRQPVKKNLKLVNIW